MNTKENIFVFVRYFLFFVLFLTILGSLFFSFSGVLVLIKHSLSIKNPEIIDLSTLFLMFSGIFVVLLSLVIKFRIKIISVYNG